ncbi:PEP-utilizing enzyme [Paenibacillus apiarius]|uniref:PEP-utilizing enzyme n=1 Tax=Paenibacillus apiarius TaxID=46240 RepID=UPI001F0900C1|nr:PEP-utilizing enzyme [Paenibacillus apiarius]
MSVNELEDLIDGKQAEALSQGEAEGVVKVIRGPQEFHKLKPGDILVCTNTNPAWTPLFSVAAAVVTDTGGVLSHSAIVAREYGIPAVKACGNATKVLADGERVICCMRKKNLLSCFSEKHTKSKSA